MIAIIAILAALLLPALNAARTVAKRSQCAGNMHNVGLAALNYAVDYNDFVPIYLHEAGYFPSWRHNLLEYTSNRIVFDCVSTNKPWNSTDAANSGSIGLMYMAPNSYQGPNPANPSQIITYNASAWVAWPLKPGIGWKNPSGSIYVADSYCSNIGITYPSVEWIGTNHIHPTNYGNYYTGVGGSRRFADRHMGTNLYFLDGHQEVRKTRELDFMVSGAADNIWDNQ